MSANRTVKVGIIGCGNIANSKHMPSLKKVEGVEMVAFCDIDISCAKQAAKDFGTPDAKVYADYKDLLAQSDVEVVHVCTPNRSHASISIAALDAGKHVMCEKPMAINSKEAAEMLEASKRNNKKLTIGYQARNFPESQFLKAEAEKGTFGDIYYAKATAIRRRAVPTWGVFLNENEQGGGPLIDIGTHALDLTLWLMNNYKPKYCVGTAYHKLNNEKNTGNAWGDWDPDKFTVEDSAFGFIVMENGATIVLESAWALNTLDVREAKSTICGTKAGGDMNGGANINSIINGRQCVTTANLSLGGVLPPVGNTPPAGAPTAEQIEATRWIDAIRNDTDPYVLPEQAYCVTRILEGIYESAKTGTIYNF